MNAEPEHLETVFANALQQASAEERAAYLSQACAGHSGLQQRVEALLQAHDAAAGFLQPASPRQAVTANQPAITERPGSMIGPYKLLQQIGEGGMGVVYMAEQQEPVRRKVALKIIKPGMDSREVIARFEAERQALAMMDHVNIAKVLEAGTTPGEPGPTNGEPGSVSSGRPYFVMELVHGVSITKYCDDNKLTPRQRLELFIPVCQAIQHAHQKGIIHRDIKPSNVMVTMYDDKPVPKIIDFGVAKAIEQRLTEKSLFTQYGALVGTFEYMSPEQAELNAFGVDTRSDIYSLGVLLYELLTGTTPLERQRLREAAYVEIVRLIKEEEPVRPSLRLSTSAAALAGISRERGTEPSKLAKLVRGELDWIVLRCLEKDRARRYETASALAQDIQHFLAEEPVLACPPSTWYRFRKMARRNKAAMTTAALVAGILLLGTVVSTWQAVRARRAQDAALSAEAEALATRDREAQARRAADEQRKLAVGAAADSKASQQLAEVNAALATKQEQIARDQMKIAEEERQKAQASEQTAQCQLYATNFGSARREFEANRILSLMDYLQLCPQDLRGWEHNYLYTLFNQQSQTLPAGSGKGNMCSVVFSPNGRYLAAAGRATVKLWDAATWKELYSHPRPSSAIVAVCFSPDSQRLAVAEGDQLSKGTIAVYDVVSGNNTAKLNLAWTKEDLKQAFNCVAFSPDGKTIVTGDGPSRPNSKFLPKGPGTVTLWDANTGGVVRSLPGHLEGIRAVAFSPDGRRLASASHDKTVKLWEVASGREYLTLNGHTAWVRAVTFSPDGKRLATGSYDKTLKLWDAASGRELFTILGHEEAVIHIAFSPDGKKIASASKDQTIKLWDSSTGDPITTFKGHNGTVMCVNFSPDGRRLASAGMTDGTVKLWDIDRPQNRVIKSKNGQGLWFNSSSGLLVSIISGRVKEWSSATGEPVREFALEQFQGKNQSSKFAMSSDRLYLASIFWEDQTFKSQMINVWNAATGQLQRTIRGLDDGGSLSFSPDSKFLAVSSVRAVNVWNLTNGSISLTLEGPGKGVLGLNPGIAAFSSDGKLLAVLCKDQSIGIWDLASGTELSSFKASGGANYYPSLCSFSPDGKRLACAWSKPAGTTSSGGPVNVVGVGSDLISVTDVASGKEIWALSYRTYCTALVFSPDGTRLFGPMNGSDFKGLKNYKGSEVKIWDAAIGIELLSLRLSAPTGALSSKFKDKEGYSSKEVSKHDIHHLTFSPDGKLLAGQNWDGIIIWDASNSMKELEKK